MASIRISQLQAITETADADFLVINDQDNETRKISFLNFKNGFLVEEPAGGSQFTTGALGIGGSASNPKVNLLTGGKIEAAGAVQVTRVNTTDSAFLAYNGANKAFQVMASGDLQLGSGIGSSPFVQLSPTGMSHFRGGVMVHRSQGDQPVFQGKTGDILTIEIDANGMYKAGGELNSGGTPLIALNPGGGIALNGNYGTAGQVLTSGGPGVSLAWSDAAGGAKGQKGEQGPASTKGQKGAKGNDGDKGQKGEAQGLLDFKGTSPDVASLPPTGNTVGDVYHVLSPDSWYAWNGASWAQINDLQQGPKGDTGDQGVKGQKGEIGVKGTKGTKGQKGEGDKGSKGEKGEQGHDGNKGEKGLAGTAGGKGQKGEIGVGVDGTKGQKGADGQKGANAGLFTFEGEVPSSGNLPSTGNTTGDVYRVSDTGLLYAWDGSQWVQLGEVAAIKGDTGEQGVKGQKGVAGQDADKGQKGQAGTTGSKGATGQKGTDGADLAAGASDQIQFNASGSLGANSNFTVNPTTGSLYCKQINASGTGVNQIGINTGGASLYLYTDQAYIGNSGSTIQIYGKLTSSAIPNATNTYNLGSSTNFWWNAYATHVNLGTTSDKQITPITGGQNNVRGLNLGGIWVSTGQSGSRSTYIGASAGTDGSNTLATENDVVCLGYHAGYDGAGEGSVLIGSQAGASLHQALGSKYVVAIGYKPFVGNFNNDVENSIAIGDNIAPAFKSGTNNIFLGSEEVQGLGSGQNSNNGNISIGAGPQVGWTGGSGNVFIGGYTTNGAFSPVQAFNGVVNNTIALGSSLTANAYIKVAWTVTSDERDKMIYGPCPHGLDFVTGLRPLAYQFKKDGRHSEMGDGKLRYGFSAQDIAELEGEQKVVIDDSYADCLKYTSDHMIPILVNAIQELKREVDSLRNHTH